MSDDPNANKNFKIVIPEHVRVRGRPVEIVPEDEPETEPETESDPMAGDSMADAISGPRLGRNLVGQKRKVARRRNRRSPMVSNGLAEARRANRLAAFAIILGLLNFSTTGSLLSNSWAQARHLFRPHRECQELRNVNVTPNPGADFSTDALSKAIELRSISSVQAMVSRYGTWSSETAPPQNPFCIDRLFEYDSVGARMQVFAAGDQVLLLSMETDGPHPPLIPSAQRLPYDDSGHGALMTVETAKGIEEDRLATANDRRIVLNKTSFGALLSAGGLELEGYPEFTEETVSPFGDAEDSFNYAVFGVSILFEPPHLDRELVAYGVRSQAEHNDIVNYLNSNGIEGSDLVDRRAKCHDGLSKFYGSHRKYLRWSLGQQCRYPILWGDSENKRRDGPSLKVALASSLPTYTLFARGEVSDAGIEGIFFVFGGSAQWAEGSRRETCFESCFSVKNYGHVRV